MTGQSTARQHKERPCLQMPLSWRHLLVRPRFRHQRGRLQSFLNLGHRGLHVGNRQAMGRCDGLDAEPFDETVKLIAIFVHVRELCPEQREICERRRHIGQVERNRFEKPRALAG